MLRSFTVLRMCLVHCTEVYAHFANLTGQQCVKLKKTLPRRSVMVLFLFICLFVVRLFKTYPSLVMPLSIMLTWAKALSNFKLDAHNFTIVLCSPTATTFHDRTYWDITAY